MEAAVSGDVGDELFQMRADSFQESIFGVEHPCCVSCPECLVELSGRLECFEKGHKSCAVNNILMINCDEVPAAGALVGCESREQSVDHWVVEGASATSANGSSSSAARNRLGEVERTGVALDCLAVEGRAIRTVSARRLVITAGSDRQWSRSSSTSLGNATGVSPPLRSARRSSALTRRLGSIASVLHRETYRIARFRIGGNRVEVHRRRRYVRLAVPGPGIA